MAVAGTGKREGKQDGTLAPYRGLKGVALITVLRRWFVPSDQLEEFTEKWRNEVMPEIRRQPGCTRVEMYESSIREHWVSAITCEDEEARLKALEVLSRHQEALAQYERFEPEILTVRSHMP